MKKALVTGACGQDGSYMSELLVSKGYEVHGLVRPSGNRSFWQLNNVIDHPRFSILWRDITEPGLFYDLAQNDYDEVYHFAAVSHVKTSFEDPAFTFQVNTIATSHLFKAFQDFSTKVYNAGSSEMFADQVNPRHLSSKSPYATSKIASHLLAKQYREQGMFIVSGIAYNHESSRRGESFVTRKIGLSLLEKGEVTLGNLQARRDWHHAKDFVEGAYLAMQYKKPEEWTFCSGQSYTVKEFAQAACDYFKLDFNEAIYVSKKYEREADVSFLEADPYYTDKILGWERKYTFKDIVEDCCAPAKKCGSFRL